MKIAMLFGGFGSQYVGMAKDFYDESRILQEYYEEASNILNINFVKLTFASSEAELAKLPHALSSLFLVNCGLFALIKNENITPDLVAGYNFGEYAAIYAAGGFSFPDGLYLLGKYAQFYQEYIEQINVAIVHIKGISAADLQELCMQSSVGQYQVSIAIINSEKDLVASGNAQAVAQLRELCAQHFFDAQLVELPLEVGLHSALLDNVAQNYAIYLEKVDFKDLTVPLVSAGDGSIVASGEQVRQRVIDLVNKPIIFNKVLDSLAEYDLIVEVGPGSSVAAMAKTKYPDKMVVSVTKMADIEELKQLIQSHTQPLEI